MSLIDLILKHLPADSFIVGYLVETDLKDIELSGELKTLTAEHNALSSEVAERSLSSSSEIPVGKRAE